MAKCHMDADGDPTEGAKAKPAKDDVKKNENPIKINTKNTHKKKSSNVANNKAQANKGVSYENGKDEIDNASAPEKDAAKEAMVAPENILPECTEGPETVLPVLATPSADQLPSSNVSGKKCYDTGLLIRIKDYPLSKEKPNIALLESCNLIRTAPIEQVTFNFMPRQVINDLLPNYARNAVNSKSNTQREPVTNDVRKLSHRNDVRGMPQRNDMRNMPPRNDGRSMSQRNDVRNMPQRNDGRGIPQRTDGSNMPQSGNSGGAAPYISISLAREDVKLNQVEDAWKPARFKMESLPEEELKTKDLYKKFRGILNKLTPQKFDTLVEKVKALEINTQARLEGVIDLVFQKAIDEPNFSEAYAAMCSKLSTIKVPSDNDPEQCVNFRVLIITRCQKQFETQTVDERVQKLEQELAECTDPAKKKELQEQLSEENRRVRMRSVGNVRFIGELYKLKMLSAKIMVYCMMTLIDKLEEEKLECLCKLLTTIGEQVERDIKHQLDSVFKKMQDIVLWQSGSISSRIRFMMQDVMDLRRGGWVSKSVVDSKPKTMVQIQKEAEQQQRNIELMNASPMGRDDARRRSGDVRRDAFSPGMDYQRKVASTSYTVDTTKLRAAMHKTTSNIKLAPSLAWNHGSGGKKPVQASNNPAISLSKNMFSVLEDATGDPTAVPNSRSEAIESARPNSTNKNTSRSGSSGSPQPHRSGSSVSPGPNSANKSTSRSGSIDGSRSDSANKINEQAPIEAPQLISERKSTSRSESVEASRSNSVSRSSSPSESIEPSQSSPSNSTNQSASMEAPRSKTASKSTNHSGSTEALRSKSTSRSTSPSISIETPQTSPSESSNQSASIEAARSKSASRSTSPSMKIETPQTSPSESSNPSASIEAARSKSASRSTSPSIKIETPQTSPSESSYQSASIEAPHSKPVSKSIKHCVSTEAPRSKSASRSTSPSITIEPPKTSPSKSTSQSASSEAPHSKPASKSTKHPGSTEATRSKSASKSTKHPGSTEATRSKSASKSNKHTGSKELPRPKSASRSTSPSISIEASQASPCKSTKQFASIEASRTKTAGKNNKHSSIEAPGSKSSSKSIKHSSVESPRSDVANKGYTHPDSVEAPQLNSGGKNTNHSRLTIETPRPDSGINCPGSIEESRSNSADKSSDQSGSIEISNNSGSIEAPWPNLRSSPVPQDPVHEAAKMQKELKLLVAEMLINPNDAEFVSDFKRTFPAKYHSPAVAEMLEIALEKPPKDVQVIAKAIQHLVSNSTVSSEDFLTGIQETLQFAPDLYIDIPLLYEHLAKFIAPLIANEHITFAQAFSLCGNIISFNHGHLFLEAVIKGMLKHIDPPAIERKWRDSGLELGQWMSEGQVTKFINSNGLEFIDFGYGIKTVHFEGVYNQSETQNIILLGLMKYDNDDFELIKYWMQYNFERESREGWFFDALLEALCEYALFNVGGPSLSRQSLKKCAPLLYAFGGDTPEERQESCLSGIRQLLQNLQYPPGMQSEIFSYLRSKGFIPPENVSKWKSLDTVTETSDGDANSI